VKVPTWDAWFEASVREFNRLILGIKDTNKKHAEGISEVENSTAPQSQMEAKRKSLDEDRSSLAASGLASGFLPPALKPSTPSPHGQRASSPQRSQLPGFGKQENVARHVVQTYLQVRASTPHL
jgi:hypothetical protein